MLVTDVISKKLIVIPKILVIPWDRKQAENIQAYGYVNQNPIGLRDIFGLEVSQTCKYPPSAYFTCPHQNMIKIYPRIFIILRAVVSRDVLIFGNVMNGGTLLE